VGCHSFVLFVSTGVHFLAFLSTMQNKQDGII
jgi:hypothetical protein